MRVRFTPSVPHGTVAAPPSKSMAHRYLIGAAYSADSTVYGVADSEDMFATLDGLRALGARAERTEDGYRLGGLSDTGGATFSCRESGSTLRFLLPTALRRSEPVTLTGSPRLLERGVGVYEQLCGAHGLYFKQNESGITVRGPLTSGRFTVAGNISSQFISGLMFALPTLQGDSELVIVDGIESGSYIELTRKALSDFGIKIEKTDTGFFIPGGQTYQNRTLRVEGDWSNAAFLSALGAEVTGLDAHSAQGDKIYPTLFDKLGQAPIDLSDCPDLGPVLFALAAARGGGEFIGTRRLKIKESDRSEAMKAELAKFGIDTKIEEDRVCIAGTLHPPTEPLCGHNDHRIVMALAVLCAQMGGEIDGAEAVSKSYPDFFETIEKLNVQVKKIETR